MKYIRTRDGNIELNKEEIERVIIAQADTIEELIQIGDIVFYWSSNDDKEHAHLIRCNMEIIIFRREVITKLLIPVGEDYKCVAKGYPSFNLIRNKRYLVNKGELELI